jgi:DNA-binding transcriptional regulator YiaG
MATKPKPPTPTDIKRARVAAGLTTTAAAAIIYCGARAWENWEQPVGSPEHRPMHPAKWELFRFKTMVRGK